MGLLNCDAVSLYVPALDREAEATFGQDWITLATFVTQTVACCFTICLGTGSKDADA